MEQEIYLLLGGNIGDRRHYLEEGIKAIAADCGSIISQSSMYETAAWGKEDQQAFLNMALQIRSELTPHDLLKCIASIEKKLGRQREEIWGSRTLDIDILFYGADVIRTPDLTIPHAHLQDRRFVLAPLAEIAPSFIHPVLQQTIASLLATCKDSLAVTRLP